MIENFFGQVQIVKWLNEIYIPLLLKGQNFNFLLKAPSGMGKTYLATKLYLSLDPYQNNGEYLIPDDSGKIYCQWNKRIYIIDEVHTFKMQELFYPVMDSNRFILIFCTNEYGELKEPLQNRCVNLIFKPYSQDEMIQLIDNRFQKFSLPKNKKFAEIIAINGNGNPRLTEKIVENLYYYKSAKNKYPKSEEDLTSIIKEFFGLKDGFNELHEQYLDFLRKVGRASLDLISYALKIDKMTIKRDIEPVLVSKKLILITTRGRFLVNDGLINSFELEE